MTDAFVVELDAVDPQKEILLSSANGFAWRLNRNVYNTTTNQWRWLDPDVFLPFDKCSYAKVVPVHFGSAGGTPTHLLAFTNGSDRLLQTPPQSPNMVELWTFPTPAAPANRLSAAPSSVEHTETLSFAWLSRPLPNAVAAECAIANRTTIQAFAINVSGLGSVTGASSLNITPDPDPVVGDVTTGTVITSLDAVMLQDGAGSNFARLIYSDCKGRIYVLDNLLQYLRTSEREFGTPPSFNLPAPPSGEQPYAATPWPSNRTLAQTPACDFVQGLSSQGDFYFAETATPAFTNPSRRYRIGRIGIGTGSAGGNSWTPFVERAVSGAEWDVGHPHWTRTLQVEDFDGDGDLDVGGRLEHRVFTETGVAWFDTANDAVREFQTSSFAPNWMGGFSFINGLQSPPDCYSVSLTQGGRVFERLPSRVLGDYWHLGGNNFNIPHDGHFASFGSGDGWWYRQVGANFMTGQIASNMQSANELSLGTSMKKAMIRTEENGPLVAHVATGTTGGFVCVIEPTGGPPSSSTTNGAVDATLRHISPPLGTYVIGLDVGNLDNDPDDEIVCGTLVDHGTYVDWTNGAMDKNRAHLHLLDPVVGGSSNIMNEIVVGGLTGDDLFSPPGSGVGPGFGIGAGVTGVKIDDADADGDAEIWCSDAAGHIYLFGKDSTGAWKCVYRSSSLGSYLGFYNNLHPIKGGAGKTKMLVVQSPGYTMLFDVANALVDPP